MKEFQTKLNFDFSGVSMQDLNLTRKECVENKMIRKIEKHRFKRSRKTSDDIECIREIIECLNDAEQIDLLTKAFDSPNIVLSYVEQIERLYIATWAITPAGIAALEEISRNGIVKEVIVMLDRTHSYKWIFQSDAYKILKNKVRFKFTASHSKYICYQLADGRIFNFIGSMNFSNNPRYENISINKSDDDFRFYTDFIKNVPGEWV